MQKITHWEECDREDLYMIPKMIESGWEPIFNYKDRKHNRISPEYCPHDEVTFKKGLKHIWKAYVRNNQGYSFSWAVGDLEVDHFINKRNYDTLNEIIEKEV